MAEYKVFENPANRYREKVKQGFNLPAIIFGPLYYFSIGLAGKGIMWLLLASLLSFTIVGTIIVWIIAGAMANRAKEKWYYRNGWILVESTVSLNNLEIKEVVKPAVKVKPKKSVNDNDGIQNLIPVRNLKKVPTTFIMLDVETTGTSYKNDEIVEISLVRYVNGEIESSLNKLINPEVPIPRAASRVNKITDDMVQDQPVIADVINEIYEYMKDWKIAGYNVTFDLDFLSEAFKKNGLALEKVLYIDVLPMAKKTISSTDVNNYKLETIKKYLGIKTDSHRSFVDCETTFEVMKYCLNMVD
jgi:DNA polymerase III epsilon subunit family exonuclease